MQVSECWNTKRHSDKQHGVDAAIVLRVVRHLSVLSPDNLAVCCDEAEFRDVDLWVCTYNAVLADVRESNTFCLHHTNTPQ